MFVELDTRQDAGCTVSHEWDRDSGETQIVVADIRDASLLAFLGTGENAGERIPPSVQVRAITGWVTRGADAADSRGAGARHMDQGAHYGGEPGQAGLADSLGTRLGPAATFATTEHFNLQTARAVTVSEANGRASIYLAALSGNLIALAFIGQISRLGAASMRSR